MARRPGLDSTTMHELSRVSLGLWEAQVADGAVLVEAVLMEAVWVGAEQVGVVLVEAVQEGAVLAGAAETG